MQKSKQKHNLKLKPKELVLMSNLYLNKDYPYNFLTLEDAANIMIVSKATASTITKGLEKVGLLTKVRGYITFYYPIKDDEIRRNVLEKLGFFS